jgi:hypothetical protein
MGGSKFIWGTAFVALLVCMFTAPSDAHGAAPQTNRSAIFVANPFAITAYPVGARGDVPPIALTTDMVQPSGVAADASGKIYVANPQTNTITVYPAGSNGNVAPLAVIGGAKTRIGEPVAVALDSQERVYVANKSSITVYPPLRNDTGILNEAPLASIAGINTMLIHPIGLALDAHQNIYVADEAGNASTRDQGQNRGRILIFRAGSSGSVTPLATIAGAHTQLSFPLAIALDSNSNIYVVNDFTAGVIATGQYANPSITVYSAGSTGDVAPIATIAGSHASSGYEIADAIAVDSRGNVYVAGFDGDIGNNISVFPPGSNGNVSPRATIVGLDTGLDAPGGLALDSRDNLYVSNLFGGANYAGSVTVYPAGAMGDAAPTAAITSSFDGLSQGVSGLAMDSAGNLYVSEYADLINIYAPGSFGTVPPIASITGADTGLDYPYAIGLDATGNVAVLNRNNVITVYPPNSSGNVAPKVIINIDRGGPASPNSMTVGSHGEFYVANQGGENCDRVTCVQTSLDNVAVYPADSNGDAKPSAVISGIGTDLASPSAVAVDQIGNIFVANEGPVKCVRGCDECIGIPDGDGKVTVYNAGSDGDVTPSASIAGPHTGLKFPYAIALDADRNIYILNATQVGFICAGPFTEPQPDLTGDPILIFAAGSSGDVSPISIIDGAYTALGLYGSDGIAIGPEGP